MLFRKIIFTLRTCHLISNHSQSVFAVLHRVKPTPSCYYAISKFNNYYYPTSQQARNYSADIPENYRNQILRVWLRTPLDRIAASGKLRQWFLLSLVASFPLFWPISIVYIGGLGVSVLRSNLISPASFTENGERVVRVYIPQSLVYQAFDGLFLLYTSFIYHLPGTMSATLMVNDNYTVMTLGIVLTIMFSVAGIYFLPAAVGYALSKQFRGNRWTAIFHFRKIFNWFRRSDLLLYHYAMFTTLLCSLITLTLGALTLGFAFGPAFLWQALVMAEAFGDALRVANFPTDPKKEN
jgi:hypothetical protein